VTLLHDMPTPACGQLERITFLHHLQLYIATLYAKILFGGSQLLIMSAFTAPEASQDPAEAAGGADDKKPGDGAPSVRFSSAIEEIAPTRSPLSPEAVRSSEGAQDPPEVSAEQLKEFSQSLQSRQLQERRMTTFQFEAFSLPPSRVRCNLAPSDLSFAAMIPFDAAPCLREGVALREAGQQ
jgi:hypothetical protein